MRKYNSRVRSVRFLAALVVAAALVWVPAVQLTLHAALPAAPSVTLRDPEGHPVNPFLAGESSSAIVFLFASVDCPVSNRYAPAVQRLHAEYAPRNVAFWAHTPRGAEPD